MLCADEQEDNGELPLLQQQQHHQLQELSMDRRSQVCSRMLTYAA
jgi:hypothetical protein